LETKLASSNYSEALVEEENKALKFKLDDANAHNAELRHQLGDT
jgi:hypothetical protein